MVFFNRLYSAAAASIKPAIKTAIWILKLMIPITLLVACLNYLGVVVVISEFLSPVFKYIGLSGDAVLVFITSILLNVYSAIAVIATIGFDYRSVTVLAVMCLIAHNLIIETAIQKKTGASATFMVILRIVAALVAGALLNLILPKDMTGRLVFSDVGATPTSWAEVFSNWARSLGGLTLKMLCFIVGLNMLQNILREFKIIDILIYPLKPFVKVFGLPESTSFLWVIANTVGLAYGGAVMITEIEKGEIKPEDAKLLNTHIAISHSLLEDTLLFATIGIGALWLFIPRLVLSFFAVWGERLFRYIVKRA